MEIKDRISALVEGLPGGVMLVATSKTHSEQDIMEAYNAGQRVFGESRVQELCAKQEVLPKDIRWHMIGHLQRNKVKYIAPFVELIHSVDSVRLMEAIDKEAQKNDRVIDILVEVFVATEETKHGWKPEELLDFIAGGGHKQFENVRIRGVMGMASLSGDEELIKSEFTHLREIYERLRDNYFEEPFDTLSMGMTADYRLAVDCGSTMVRIGSLIFD